MRKIDLDTGDRPSVRNRERPFHRLETGSRYEKSVLPRRNIELNFPADRDTLREQFPSGIVFQNSVRPDRSNFCKNSDFFRSGRRCFRSLRDNRTTLRRPSAFGFEFAALPLQLTLFFLTLTLFLVQSSRICG